MKAIFKFKYYQLLLPLIISYGFGNLNIKVGFSIKPYMVIVLLIFVLAANQINITRLRNYERAMIAYFIWYIATIVKLNYIKESLWYSGVIVLLLGSYYIIRGIIIKTPVRIIERYIKYAGLIICIASITYYIIGIASFNFYPTVTQQIRYGVMIDRYLFRFMGTINEPNITSIYLSLFFFFYLYNLKSKYCKLGLLLTSTCIILTLSRGAYVSFIITILITPLFSHNRILYIGKFFKNILIFTTLLFALNIVFLNYNIDILSPIQNRFSEIETDSGSGRLDLWECALNAFLNNPIMGIGLNGIRSYNIENYGSEFDNYTHNSYLEVLAESGLVGFILFIYMIASAYQHIYIICKKNKHAIYILATYTSIIFQMLFISIQHNEFIFFILLLIYRYGENSFTRCSSALVMHVPRSRTNSNENKLERLICNNQPM